MILSNKKIHEALDRGFIKILPEPTPRMTNGLEGNCPLPSQHGHFIQSLLSSTDVIKI